MSNDKYIGHHLNSSVTKQTHRFPKERRFSRHERIATQAIYDLPSMKNKRSAGFGYGNKVKFGEKSRSPPPGTYHFPSQFQKTTFNNTPSMAKGRDNVCFGSFLLEAIKDNKHKPSPTHYKIQSPKDKRGGRLGGRLNSEPGLVHQKQVPGPGAYELKATQMSTGNYFLSNYKNNTSPRYFPELRLKEILLPRPSQTVSFNKESKQTGKYQDSRYKNTVTNSFSKSKREGMHNKHSLKTPGFKYGRFSEFGS